MTLHPEQMLLHIQELRAPAREALEIVTQYYCMQVEPELLSSPGELKAVLADIRRGLACRALVEALPIADQAHVQVVFGDLLPSPLPVEHPMSRVHHVDVLFQEVSVELICWQVRTGTSFILNDGDRLPSYECFRHGDPVIVRAADWTSYPFNGCTGKFQRYTDPRISHHDRWTAVHLDGEPDEKLAFIRPAHLEFAPEKEALSVTSSDAEIRDEAWREGEPIEFYERLGTWSRDGFTLQLYDTGQIDRLGKSILAYELFDENFEHFGEEPIFQGADFHCSPLQDRASDAAAADLLGFLNLRPEDSDSERLDSYTAEQRRWSAARGRDLAFVAEQYDQRQQWRELHLLGQTEEAILAVARYGRAEDIFEVLALDIFDAYDLVDELARGRDDLSYSDLGRLLRELHYLRNVEIVGGEDEMERLYG